MTQKSQNFWLGGGGGVLAKILGLFFFKSAVFMQECALILLQFLSMHCASGYKETSMTVYIIIDTSNLEKHDTAMS